MHINALMISIIVFTLLISGCTDKNTNTANESINAAKNNIIEAMDNTTASELPENITSKDNDLSINIILEKPPKEVIGGD